MILHKALWHAHPHVRTGAELTVGERAADVLKRTFGSWAFLGVLNLFIIVWAAANWAGIVHFDPYPFIALNLVLSWLASQQGGALQIAANRGDRIASELALSTHANGERLLTLTGQNTDLMRVNTSLTQQVLALTRQQMTMVAELRALRAAVGEHGDTGGDPQ